VSANDGKSIDGQEKHIRGKMQVVKTPKMGVKQDGRKSFVDLLLCADFNRWRIPVWPIFDSERREIPELLATQ